MMNDPLFLCRMMMRLYTVAPDENGVSRSPALWESYQEIEEGLFAAFRAENIRPVPVRVLSDFNGTIRSVLELVFCAAEPTIPIPEELYRLFGDYGVKGFTAPAEPPVIRLAYTGRCYDYETKTRLITDGLQIGSLGKIALDFYSLDEMTKAGVSCRLTHEILHVFGVSEEEMVYYKPKAYLGLLDHVNRLSDKVLAAAEAARPVFERSAGSLAAANPQWLAALTDLGQKLKDSGYPDAPERAAKTALRLPENVIDGGTVTYAVRDVLYM